MPGDLVGCGRDFRDEFRVLYLHPEFISPGKFTSDLLRLTEPSPDGRSALRSAGARVLSLST